MEALPVLAVCVGRTTLAWAWPATTHRKYTDTIHTRRASSMDRPSGNGVGHALGAVSWPSRAQPMAADHSLDLHASGPASRARPVACP